MKMIEKCFSHLLQMILMSCLIIIGCEDNGNPVDSSKFLTTAGPILFISDISGTSQLYSMNEDGSNVQQLTNDPNFPISDAKWSPDGSKIAVVSLVGDSMTYPSFRDAIFIMDADGSNRYQLTKQWFYVDDSTYGKLEYGGATNPVWSPDSKQVAYSRLMVPEAIANQDIFIINIDGSEERRITSTINSFETVLDWGGNNRAILALVMINFSPFTKVLMYTSDGAILTSWADNGLGYSSMVFSSRGDKIAFVVDFYPGSLHQDSIFVANLDNGVPVNITKGGVKFYSVVYWSPNDLDILVSGSNGDVNKMGRAINTVLILKSNGSSIRNITPFENVYIRPTSWRRR